MPRLNGDWTLASLDPQRENTMSKSTVTNHPTRASARSLLMLSGASAAVGAFLWLAPHAQTEPSNSQPATVTIPVYEGPAAPFTGGVAIRDITAALEA
jgi:hypothetical protein